MFAGEAVPSISVFTKKEAAFQSIASFFVMGVLELITQFNITGALHLSRSAAIIFIAA